MAFTALMMLVGRQEGIQPVKTSASKPLGMAVNVSEQRVTRATMWI